MSGPGKIAELKKKYPQKCCSENAIFQHIRRGCSLLIGTGCGEPQYLVKALMNYVRAHPKAFSGVTIFHIWTMGAAPYTDPAFKYNFRHTSFFIGEATREAINQGDADYIPTFLSNLSDLFQGALPVDVALIQTSPPDKFGYMSLGISVDIVKAAVEQAKLVIAQVNSYMPRIHGDTFIHIDDVDFIVAYDEPLLEYESRADEISQKIGKYVARIIKDGDTIQVGFGKVPNAVLSHLHNKKHLGIHTVLLTEGAVELIKKGVVDNSKKTLNRGKTVAAFCMAKGETYDYLHDNPVIEFKPVSYTNSPAIISQHANMTAISGALEIDLTGQVTAESIGTSFYSGLGGQTDFFRGALIAPGGKTIVALPSTAKNCTISRIVPVLKEGAGVTFTRGDIHYVVTEYGIAYLHGKNIRERAMSLIAIAHPKFRPWLIEEAKKLSRIYKDQAFIPGKAGEYPEHLETYRTTKTGIDIFLRPVKISDEPLVEEFFNALSDKALYQRFVSGRTDMSHERLQEFVIIDYTKELVILAVIPQENNKELVVGIGQMIIARNSMGPGLHAAEAAFLVRDDYQNRGIGTELLKYVTVLAKRQGLLGFFAEVLIGNKAMIHLFEKMDFDIQKTKDAGVVEMIMTFR
ncbi:MAG: GNAT family N-acetyltransferase [Candidatus Hermodarchaeota archaeon]